MSRIRSRILQRRALRNCQMSVNKWEKHFRLVNNFKSIKFKITFNRLILKNKFKFWKLKFKKGTTIPMTSRSSIPPSITLKWLIRKVSALKLNSIGHSTNKACRAKEESTLRLSLTSLERCWYQRCKLWLTNLQWQELPLGKAPRKRSNWKRNNLATKWLKLLNLPIWWTRTNRQMQVAKRTDRSKALIDEAYLKTTSRYRSQT